MSEWINCPKCGALMIGFTGGHICPLCGYRVPAYTVTSSTGTSSEFVQVVRCKDCKFVGTDATCCLVCNREGMGLRPFHVYHDDFCSYAERKEE